MPSHKRKAPKFIKMKIILGCALAYLAYTGLDGFAKSHGLLINQTESLPNWAFWVDNGQAPEKGEYIVFDPGKDPLTLAYFGEKPQPFIKIVYGVEGDNIRHIGNEVYVNQKPMVTLKPLTQKGDKLTPGPIGTVPKGCYFAGTPHKDGFDSRYESIGFVCRDRLIGKAVSLL